MAKGGFNPIDSMGLEGGAYRLAIRTAHELSESDSLCHVGEALPPGNVAYTRHGIKWANGGFLYPSGNSSLMTFYDNYRIHFLSK